MKQTTKRAGKALASGAVERGTVVRGSRAKELDDHPARSISFSFGHKVYTEVIEGNIQLSEMTSAQMQEAINRAVGSYAHYGSLRADAKRLQSKIDTDFEAWKAIKYAETVKRMNDSKATGKAIEMQMLLDFSGEYSAWARRKRQVDMVCDKLYVLMQSFELMTKTLQSCMAMLRTELDHSIRAGSATGSGDFTE